ncbi:uncharacterized protein LOC128389979 [Panonychus citri]|uniref:uncharacterized protein LOC128389979 n=1 Tax=Panonychus citri TaxID=50023 RepID=UPI002307C7DB|nr:uncharacterized protein LOC128389979 [Panonychus citri]
MDKLQYSKLCETALEPYRSSDQSSGYDLASSSSEPIIIPPAGGQAIIPTGIAIALPAGYTGRIASRSSLSCIHHVEVGAGVIDADYRGNIHVVLYNHHSSEPFTVNCGDRIGQLLIEKVFHPQFEAIEPDQILNTTDRASKGLGNQTNV